MTIEYFLLLITLDLLLFCAGVIAIIELQEDYPTYD